MERSQNKLASQMLHAAKEIAEYRKNDITKSFAKVINGVGVCEKLNYNPEKNLILFSNRCVLLLKTI